VVNKELDTLNYSL